VVTHSRIPTGAVSNPLDPTLRTPYRERETVYHQGANFTPNRYLPLALYKGAFATFEVLNQLPYGACPDAPLSNLVVGARAKMVDDVANNLRASSGQYSNSPMIGQIQPGDEVLGLGGPACDSGYTWWLVYDENNRLVGWAAEGDFNELWLAPLE
jgi:hypothetical protein